MRRYNLEAVEKMEFLNYYFRLVQVSFDLQERLNLVPFLWNPYRYLCLIEQVEKDLQDLESQLSNS